MFWGYSATSELLGLFWFLGTWPVLVPGFGAALGRRGICGGGREAFTVQVVKCQHLLQSDLAVHEAEFKAVKFWVLCVIFLFLLHDFHHVAAAPNMPYCCPTSQWL